MKRYHLLLLSAAIFFSSCKKDDPYVPQLGDAYQGGYIFYIDATGEHGLVMGPPESETSLPWGCAGTLLDATSNNQAASELGWGMYCTSRIVVKCAETNTAARYCYNLEYGGYKDWFLPNLGEWNLMIKNIGASTGLALKASSRYWIAYEADANRGAYCVPSNPGIGVFDSKSNFYLVRPVRAF
jgi:hypothetical protein